MSPVLKMPRLGETMEEGRIVAWLVAEGATFARGDVLLEVETDKTVVEVPALGVGTLVEHLVAPGDAVGLGADLARLAIDGPDWTVDAAAPDGPAQAAPASAAASEAQPSANAPSRSEGQVTGAPPEATPHPRRRATPLARRLARQRGIDLAGLRGTGRRGRIEASDVPGAPQDAGARPMVPPSGGQAAPLLLLHGFAADRTVWAGLSARLSHAGRQVVAPDLPGHGANPCEAQTAGDLFSGLEEALDQNTEGAAPHVVAHSMGALPAIALAERAPVASLTLIAPLGLSHAVDATFIRGLADPGSAGEVEHLLGRMVAGRLPLSPQGIDDLFAELSRGRLVALAEALLGRRGQAVSLRAPLARLADRLPVRLILGHRDAIVPWEAALDVSPRIAIHHMPGVGHVPHWEAPDEVLAILLAASGDGEHRGAQAPQGARQSPAGHV
ncbi:MAG: alpha/beta fold hydrolase [Pseudomonadota bacterium]